MHAPYDPWSASPREPAPPGPPSVADEPFRDAMARLGGGVCVVSTADHVGRDCALTVTAASSLSLDPPLVVVAVRHGSFIHDALSVSDGWALSMLSVSMLDLAMYASRHRVPGEHDDFTPWAHRRGELSKAVVFTDAVAAVECVPFELVDAGDHSLVIGRVVAVASDAHGELPLLHVDRAYFAPETPLPHPPLPE